MTSAFRPIPNFISSQPRDGSFEPMVYRDAPTSEFVWYRLRHFSESPEAGKALFSGTTSEKNAKYRTFRAFIGQAQTYWDAAEKTKGSAAALPYYYSALQLAKAELLISHAGSILGGKPVHHGLRKLSSTNDMIRSDVLAVSNGVFPMLYERRTGGKLAGTPKMRVMNLLSLIPEIGLEMTPMRPSRSPTIPGYYALAMNDQEAWSVALTLFDVMQDPRDHLSKAFRKIYEPIPQSEFENWRNVFALSSRVYGGGVNLYQAKKTMQIKIGPSSIPDMHGALAQLTSLGQYLHGPDTQTHDFYLTPTIAKTSTLQIPLDLIRYAALFYLSSLVRYSPSALDPFTNGQQAYLMDSFAHEVPLRVLIDALDGITGTRSHFDTRGYRL